MNKQVVVGVCHGPRCRDYGGLTLAEQLKYQGMAVEALDCQSLCTYSPIVRLHDRVIHRATDERVTGVVVGGGGCY
ncbi:MAG: (2Fe-2S) ferredoxin domain-containing protein [Mariprofundus sp.]|nr:(2Fe-2S) ferredoxin domain-containing protein [Mariprofundus sp.]